jgi:4-hydroxybenzoate polyprenyltransferase/phosphoserine phosphatase
MKIDVSHDYPLVVDLDGTLLCVDSLIEMFVVNLLRQPWAAVKALFALLRGRGSFKRRIAEINLMDVTLFPVHRELLAYLREQKAKGRELFLVTAADQDMANTFANQLGIFSDTTGSIAGRNLKGSRKLAYLEYRFPDGFSYAGDSAADIPIWRAARTMILVGANGSTRRALADLDDRIEREFRPEWVGPRPWLKALRVHQWAKNLLLFMPLLLAHKYGDPAAIITALLAFPFMGLVASGTYLLNDLSDLDADRAHPTKRDRPVASGTIGAGSALIVALVCVGLGLLGALSISLQFLLMMLIYFAATLAYSLVIKRIAMLDVVTLGGLYTLRVMMGTVAINIGLSPWLLMFSLFFFLGFSLAKRYVEIVTTAEVNSGNEFIRGRGYKFTDGPLLLTFGITTSVVAVLILTLYIANDAFPTGAYRAPQLLWLIAPIVLLWTMRVWLLCYRGEMHDDPVAFAVTDRVSWLLGFLVMLSFVAATQ